MREKFKSELVKDGPGDAHEKAKDRLVNILMDNGWEVFPDARFSCTYNLASNSGVGLINTKSEHFKALGYHGYIHEFDIFAKKEHDNCLVSQLVIEIDGKAHDSEVQQGKDKTAANYARFFLPDARLERIHISFIIGKNKFPDEDLIDFYKLK